uniref:Myosin-binding protein C, fast-type n=1 Tax=Cyprinus carpio TaxID=7962 RepID=A0A8C1IIL1_CYPCA
MLSERTELTGLFLEKPESVVAITGIKTLLKLQIVGIKKQPSLKTRCVCVFFNTGKDVTFVVKVDSTNLTRKPTMKWLKGKWMDLGSKAGKHIQLKESYDRNTKIYTYEMKIVKVVPGDAGGYRCEVSAKDKCDSCTFEITVEEGQADILSTFKRAGAGEDEGELDFSALLKKPEPELEIDVWELLKNAHPSEYEKIAFQYGITDLRGMLKRLKKMKAVEPKISEAFLRRLESAYSVNKGKKIVLSVEVTDPNAEIKWLKNGQEIKPSAKYIMESDGNIRTLTINKCSLADDAAYECVVGTDKCFTEVFVKEPPITITKLLDDYQVVVGERVEFEIEVSEEGAHVIWMFEDQELSRDDKSSKYRFKKDGKRHCLIIQEATTEDSGMYFVYTNGGQSKGELIVEEKELEVLQSIADLTVKSSEQAMFKCEVSDEKVTGKWFKDGKEVQASKRIKISHIGRFHRLTIDDVKPEDAGDYTFIPDGYAISLSAKLNFLDPPKIHLDVAGNLVSQNTIIVVAGNKLRLDVEITGEPAPTVCWMKGDKPVTDAEGRVRVENRKDLSSLVIEGAEREDEGNYTITVTNPAGEDKANLFIKIVDVPDPPENVKCTGVGEDCATIIWEPPKFDGGAPLKGYLMERKKKGSSRWTKLNFDAYENTTYEAKRMIEGILYEIRVFAVNGIGISAPSLNSKPFMPIAPTSEPTKLIVDDVTDTTCSLKWLAPERIGAGGLDGYIIEFCKEGGASFAGIVLCLMIVKWHPANTDLIERQSYVVRNLPTGEKMDFRVVAVNMAGRSPPALLGQPVTVREIMALESTKYIKKVGEKINLVIPFQGKPRPVATWLKDGQPVDEKKVGIRNSNIDSILFIRSAEREHSGKYTLSLKIENMEDSANIDIRIVDKPGPPTQVHVTDVWGFNAALDKQSPYKEKDMTCAPKFTAPLVDRSVTIGYSTAISCAVRGFPKPKIIWMKNKMIIDDNPKFLMQNNQGVLTLNIRKPSTFDSGKYSCKAVNELGEDEVECKLEIRGNIRVH